MTEDSNKNEHAGSAGYHVLKEAVSLLRNVRFSPNEGVSRCCNAVSVSVDSIWNDDGQSMTVVVTCFARGHQLVDWSHLVFMVASEDDRERILRHEHVDAQGQAVFTNLPPREYSLRSYQSQGSGQKDWQPYREGSIQGRLRSYGEIKEVGLKTRHPNLCHRQVSVALIAEENGTVDKRGEITLGVIPEVLAEGADEQEKWGGIWQVKIPGSFKYELLIAIDEDG